MRNANTIDSNNFWRSLCVASLTLVGIAAVTSVAMAQPGPESQLVLLQCKDGDEVLLEASEPDVSLFEAETYGFELQDATTDPVTGYTTYVFAPGPVICVTRPAPQ